MLAASLGKIASKYATRAQTAEKASSSKPTRNPDFNILPDQNIMTQTNSVLSEICILQMYIIIYTLYLVTSTYKDKQAFLSVYSHKKNCITYMTKVVNYISL